MQLLKIASRVAFKCMRERGDDPFHTRQNSRNSSYPRVFYYRSEIEILLYPSLLSNKLLSLPPQQSATFSFGGNTIIRTKFIDSRPYFVAKDVCSALEIINHKDAMTRLDEDEKRGSVLPTLSGSQNLWLLNESGLYHLIFQSRKPEAKAFRKWITAEVLPALYRTGHYEIPRPNLEKMNDRFYPTTTDLFS